MVTTAVLYYRLVRLVAVFGIVSLKMSLVDVCIDCIKHSHKYKTVEGLLLLYNKLDLSNPSFRCIVDFIMKGLNDKYPMMHEKYGIEEMKLIFSPADLAHFEKERQTLVDIKNRVAYLKGTVIQPDTKEFKPSEDGFYPIEALVQGVTWPSNVDPANREKFLSEEDFVKVFKMTKEEFKNKDKFVRMRLKKEYRLF